MKKFFFDSKIEDFFCIASKMKENIFENNYFLGVNCNF